MSLPAPKPKLLYLVSEDWYFVSHRLALAVAAKERGYDVVIATRVGKEGGTIRDAGLTLRPIEFERSGLGPASEAATLARLIALYRRERPKLVHHVAVKPVVYGSIAARVTGVSGIVNALMGLGFVFTSETTKARALRPLVRAGLKPALRGPRTRIIVQNADDAELLAREHLARPENLRLIRGSGVDPAAFAVTPPPHGVPLVVLPARLLADKGVNEFVAAAEILKRDGVAARFALVGDPDPLNPSAIPLETVKAWVTRGLVEHWGWKKQSEMPAVLAAASLVCLPSYREGLPKSLLEAAAAGRAIVAADVPGNREIVRPGVNGWLVPARDAAALAAALREALADPMLCARYGAAGRAMVENEMSIRHVIDATLAVYAELVPPV